MMVVDDVKEVTGTICKGYQWEKLGITDAVGVADSCAALKMIETQHWDILITDIKMPKIDGLELSKKALEINSNLKIIIVSGYDEFEYARKAIQIGVLCFLLKPFSFEELVKNVKKASISINAEKKRLEIDKEYAENIDKFNNAKKELFLLNLRKECQTDEIQLKNKIENFGIELKNNNCFVAEIGQMARINGEFDIWSKDDSELIRFAVMNILEEVFSQNCLLYKGDENSIYLFIFNYYEFESVKNMLRKVIDIIQNNLYIKILIGMGKESETLNNLYESFIQAGESYEYALFFEKSGLVKAPSSEISFKYPTALQNEICSKVDFNDKKDELKIIISDYINKVKRENEISKKQILEIFSSIFTKISDKLLMLGFVKAKEYNISYWLSIFLNVENVTKLQDLINKYTDGFYELLKSRKFSDKELMIDEFVRYIDLHLDATLSLNELARRVDLSPGYLAVIFKSKMGITISSYIQEKRIEYAKMLLSSTKMKIKEIALKTGYENQKYFSEKFKNIVGMRPIDYRRKHNKGEV